MNKLEISLKKVGTGKVMTLGDLIKKLQKFDTDLLIRLLYKESKGVKQERALITITMEENFTYEK